MESLPLGSVGPRSFTFSLRLGSLLGGLLLLTLSFGAVFFLGVVIGRGYAPEAGIPELARLMPAPSPSSAPRVIAPAEEEGKGEKRGESAAKPLPAIAEEIPEQAITRADLDYREHLKKNPPPSPPRANDKGAKAESKAGPTPAKAPVSKNQDKATSPPGGSKSAEVLSGKSSEGAVFNYVYQAGSYKNEAACEKFTQKLRAAGFKARTAQSASGSEIWFRTLIDFTGRPDDTNALRERLKAHGVPRALLYSKTPAR
ncbi:MAG: SPOR domain-containing protein [Desulfovibrio sp.]|jgi:cell division protein FtsN|nr:SPOR domain-containing protein [Desulfovibrio sp.]